MPKEKSQHLSDRVSLPMREIREELGMTQVQFAVAIGVDPGTISRAERGLTEPVFTIKQTKVLCKLLGKQIEDLPDYLGKGFLEDDNGSQA